MDKQTSNKLTLSYCGTKFFGWAKQPGLRTVQGELESALFVLHGTHIAVDVAGRTDRGVHAWGQVASYEGEAFEPETLNALLPSDIAVLACTPKTSCFHARHAARSRSYCYRIWNNRTRSIWEHGRSLWWSQPLNFQQLVKCAELLVGTHNFTAFTPTITGHKRMERHVYHATWSQDRNLLEFWIEANSFLRHMNRVLVGTMLEVALEKRSLADFADLLRGAPRSSAGPTVSPQGLYLARVTY